MRVVTSKEMNLIDDIAISEFGFSESLIIENVGFRGAEFIEETILKDDYYGEIVVLVGMGNNGADGLAIARHLRNKGHIVRAFVLFPDNEQSSELKKQLQMCKSFGVKISEVSATEQIDAYFTQTQEHYLVIDAILGMGFRMPLSNYLFDIANIVNKHATIMVSVDIATGVTGDVGAISGNAIIADITLAIGLPKTGHYIGEGAKHSGEIYVLDAGFPKEVLDGGDKFLLTPESIQILSSSDARSKFAHKNSFGHTLVVGGSEGMTGALIMASQAALKVGTGLVTSSTWKENLPELNARITPEVMTGTIPTDEKKVEDIIKSMERWDSIIVGPGIGRTKNARETVLDVLNHFAGPVVVDADAIRVLNMKEDGDVFRNRKFPTVMTPHMGEFSDFVGVKTSAVLERPLDYLKEAVDSLNCSIILKGSSSYIGFPSGEFFINYFPNDGMATGGSGDVLAGIIGGLLAQNTNDRKRSGLFTDKNKFYESICFGVAVHTLAGKYAAESLGPRAMTAVSIIDHLSNAFLEIENKK